MAINAIRKPCSNEEQFTSRITSLALLIDEIEMDEIRNLVKLKPKTGSINLLEAFLNEKYPNFDKTLIRNLRMIMILRSKKFPVHKDDPRVLDALNYFGFTSLTLDWQELWEKVLQRYLDSLKTLLKTLMSS